MLAHYTICGKPWWCRGDPYGLCGDFHNEWYIYRNEMEKKWSKENDFYVTTVSRTGRKWNRKFLNQE